jgi:radical SAM superfamily enzyme YgiQ (UPF0313 family)
MKNVYLFEINDVLANQAKLPYSVGLIWSHCSTVENITNNYKLSDIFWWRRPTEEIIASMENPSIVGFSCFVWNWKNNVEIAKRIKQLWPDCLVVFGGWQVPMSDRVEGFFKENPFVDIAVHGEGEITFADILEENLKEKPKWEDVKGCSVPYRMVTDKSLKNRTVNHGLVVKEEFDNPDYCLDDSYTTAPRPRITDLASMPSPYLDGLFDSLVESCEYNLESTFETTRGCPYSCTYCEIGTKYYQRIRTHKLDKIFAEIDWMAENKVVFVYNADSNFGMMKDHLDITKYLVHKKSTMGYPQKHRCDWSKNQADKVIELAKIFYEAEMDKGITIAVQSMSPDVLKAVKRKNVDGGKLKEFIAMYEGTGLPSYVELILGLPEETKESFIGGICEVLELGQHNYIGIYPLTALPNTPFGDPEYIKKYNLEIIETYPAFSHVDISDINDFEREHMVVSSRTMTREDYKECTVYRWMFMFGHYLGTLQFISRFLNKAYGVKFDDFYMNFMDFMASLQGHGFLGKQYEQTEKALSDVLKAKSPWGRVVPAIRENFAWDFEEATVLDIMTNKDTFYSEVMHFIVSNYDIPSDVLKELIHYQRAAILNPDLTYPQFHEYKYNIHDVIHHGDELKKKENKLQFDGKNYDGDFFEYGKETLWWGRRVAAYKNKIKKEDNSENRD